jgi:hypothetical protein
MSSRWSATASDAYRWSNVVGFAWAQTPVPCGCDAVRPTQGTGERDEGLVGRRRSRRAPRLRITLTDLAPRRRAIRPYPCARLDAGTRAGSPAAGRRARDPPPETMAAAAGAV